MRLTSARTRLLLAGLIAIGRNRKGLAFVEFAYALPLFTGLALYGLEMSNLALANLRVSQIASNLADTASRVGEHSGLARKQIREMDINDAFQAARIQGETHDMTERGRIILSSLERNKNGGQWIHWQRCIGRGIFTSSFGTAGDGRTGTSFPGMGRSGEEIQAPSDSAIMFVEVAYRYKPLINASLLGAPVLRAHAAFLVREPRDLDSTNNPDNPAPAAPVASCGVYSLA